MAKFEEDALMFELVIFISAYFIELLVASFRADKNKQVFVAVLGFIWLIMTSIFMYSVIAPTMAYCELSRVKTNYCGTFTQCPQADECTKYVNGKRDKLRGYAFLRVMIDAIVYVIVMK